MKTLVFGFSESPDRYSHMAYNLLREFQHETVAINPRIELDLQKLEKQQDVHTLTLYVNPAVSAKFEQNLLNLKPKRVIFNPGTESSSLQEKFRQQGAEVVIGCTLVMLRTGQF